MKKTSLTSITSILSESDNVAKLHGVSVYPDQLAEILRNPRHCRDVDGDHATGIAARIQCGCVTAIGLSFDDAGERIADAGYRTNGCGYMAASAESICRSVQGLALTELGLVTSQPADTLLDERSECAEVARRSLAEALARHREQMINEFTGEKALVCTCFGVSEEAIERLAAGRPGIGVSDVAAELRAGSGCGACRFVIQEILDSEAR